MAQQTSKDSLHFQGLDLLRGAAAVLVVAFHFSSRMDLGQLLHHGYLAVDFFFVLSGFVIDRAYGAGLSSRQMPIGKFIRLRLIRLLPLVVIGAALAAIIDLGRTGDFTTQQHVLDIVIAAGFTFFCLPVLWPTTLEQRAFPLNGPVWWLFFELCANFIVAPIYLLRRNLLVFATIIAISLTLLIWKSADTNDVHFGPHFETLMLGFPRVLFSFCVGILISRRDLKVPPISRWWYVAALSAMLVCPQLPSPFNRLWDLFAISIVFPAILVGAINCRDSQKPSAVSRISGELSYPLYAIHYPIVRVIAAATRSLGLTVAGNLVIVMISCAVLAAVSLGVFRFVDAPVRAKLNAARLKFRHP